jgi:hypothetical protein
MAKTGDGEDACPQDIGQQMGHPVRVAAVRDHPGEPISDPEPPLRLGKQHDATV